jgi:hypothetical protein
MTRGTWALFVIVVAQIVLAQPNRPLEQPSRDACVVEQIPTEWASDTPLGVIEQHSVVFTNMGRVEPTFVFRNLQTVAVQALALTLDYLDKQGRTIDRVPIVASTEQALKGFRVPFAAEETHRWENAIAPGGSALIGGIKDGIRAASCPSRAVVTFALVQLADGKNQSFATPGWRLGPIPIRVPEISHASLPPRIDPPVSFAAEVIIEASGDVIDVVSDETKEPKLLDWTRDYLKKDWKFHPALLDGHPVSSTINVLFLFHAKGTVTSSSIDIPRGPVTMIHFLWTHDVIPNDDEPDRWTVMYGFRNENSTVE